MNLYPFALDDINSAENNLEVLHNHSEISLEGSMHAIKLKAPLMMK